MCARGDVVTVEVYTPRPDDPHLDEDNRHNTETRLYNRCDQVALVACNDVRPSTGA